MKGKRILTHDRIMESMRAFAFATALIWLPGQAVAQQPATSDASYSGSDERGAHDLRLPATFHGDLPCADCEAIRHHLDLWPDQVYHLRLEWVGRGVVRDELGRWRVDPSRAALILYGGGEMPLQFEIKGPNTLRQLDLDGKPIVSNLPYELVSGGTLKPVDLNLLLAGEMTYMADAARFTECLTGRSYPIAQEGDFVKMQRGYLAAVGKPGGRLYVTFDGSIADRPKMEGVGTERTVVVRRFINAWPAEACPPPLDGLERSIWEMLARARRWSIKGPTLELSDESGVTVGLLEAVYC